MNNYHTRLYKARMESKNAAERVNKLLSEYERWSVVMMKALPVSEATPCCVAVLPNGELVVHVWVESSANPNQLHVVPAGFFDERGRARKKGPDEQLGVEP